MITDTANLTEIRLGALTQIPPGEGRSFDVWGRRIAIFHTRGGEVFATQSECPHRVGPLSDGLVGGSTLVCPLHGWKFNLSTGEALYGDCGLMTYPVHLTADGEIILGLGPQQEPH